MVGLEVKGIRTLKKGLLVLGLVAAIALVAFATLGSTASASDTGLKSPSANAVDTGGDGNGFELNPTYAYGDDTSYASNVNGAADRHRYYNYGISIPTDSTINGIAVRLDWRLDSTTGTNSMGVELSWDGGTTWTAAKNNTTESTSMHTNTLGGSTDTWGHTWTAAQLGDANFRVRLTSNSTSSAATSTWTGQRCRCTTRRDQSRRQPRPRSRSRTRTRPRARGRSARALPPTVTAGRTTSGTRRTSTTAAQPLDHQLRRWHRRHAHQLR